MSEKTRHKEIVIVYKDNMTHEITDVSELDEIILEDALGFFDRDEQVGYHLSRKSAVYEDITGFQDSPQPELLSALKDGKQYTVCYYGFDKHGDMIGMVDFAQVKNDIINSITANKYVEGASVHDPSKLRDTACLRDCFKVME